MVDRGCAMRGAMAVLFAGLVASGCGGTAAVRHVDKRLSPLTPATAHPTVNPAKVPHDPCADWPAFVPRDKQEKKGRWQRTPVPAGFQPVLLITCDTQERSTPSAGEWTYRVEKHASDGLDAVVAALRSTPGPRPTGNYACASVFYPDPWILLVDRSGRAVLPVVPHERACDQPIALGLDRLHSTVVSAKRLIQQATPAELATDCANRWKNIPKMFAAESKAATSRETVTGRPTQVCTYSSRSSKDPEVGDFTGGKRLTDDESRRIGALLTGDPPQPGVGPCAAADDFAVVHTTNGADAYVELSGCQRLFDDDGQTWTAPVPDLVRAIKALHLKR